MSRPESDEGRPSIVLTETIMLAVCLIGGYYWICSLGFSLYYLSRAIYSQPQPIDQIDYSPWQVPKTAQLLKHEETIEVETTTLKSGDRIIIQTSEIVPVDGMIVEETAFVRPCNLLDPTSSLAKCVGDKVSATDLVLVGRISVQVVKSDSLYSSY